MAKKKVKMKMKIDKKRLDRKKGDRNINQKPKT